MWLNLWNLLLETSSALVLSYFLAGLVKTYLPEISLTWLKTKSLIGQSVRGLFFALPLPICSCGVLPIYHTLCRRGVPLAAAITFLLAVPELGIDTALISTKLLGKNFTILRFGTAIVVSLAVGVIIASVSRHSAMAAVANELGLNRLGLAADQPDSHLKRISAGLKFGYVEMIDHTAVWILLGILIAAVTTTYLDPAVFIFLPKGLDIVAMAILGVPLYVCATGSTPMVASLIAKGLSPGAAITFLITGPATNLTTIAILKSLHGTRTVVIFLGVLTLLSVIAGSLVNEFGATVLDVNPTDFLTETEGHGVHDYVATILFLGLVIASLRRQGLRGFLNQLLPQRPRLSNDSGTEDCDHHDCKHH